MTSSSARTPWPPMSGTSGHRSGRLGLSLVNRTLGISRVSPVQDGPRGYALGMHFEQSLAKTMGILAGRAATMLDKEYITWLHDFGEREDRSFGDTEVPDNFYAMHGTGAFVPVDINLSVHTIYDANPNYFREGAAPHRQIQERGYQGSGHTVHGLGHRQHPLLRRGGATGLPPDRRSRPSGTSMTQWR